VHIRLTPKAFDLLGALLETRPRALSKAEIRDRLWPQTFVTEATLASVVSELRGALGDDAKEPRFVRTVHGHGYSFSGTAVEEPAQGDASQAPRAPVRTPLLVAIAVLAVGVATALVISWRKAPDRASLSVGSLAVLPFQDLGNDTKQGYVVDGLADGLVTRLAESGFTVVSRKSAMRHRQPTRPRSEIARELGADWLVEGSARRAEGRLHLVVRLVDARIDRAPWTRSYESALDETATLPSRVARDIVDAARLDLTPERTARLASARNVDPEAYDAYLRGRHQMARGSLESNRAAIELFQEALGKDPRHAPAYAQLANAYLTLATVWAGEPPRPMRGLAEAAARKALDLDPDLADAHTTLAYLKLFDWDFAGAEREFLRAIELDPSSGDAHTAYANYLCAQARHDAAIAEARLGETLDPLSVRARRSVGELLFQARRYDEAIANLQGVAAAEPRDVVTLWWLGWSLSWSGRHREAVDALERGVTASDRAPTLLGHLAAAQARAGHIDEARSLLAELEATSRARYVSPGPLVVVHAALGQKDEAFEWLERGFQERINFMVFMNNQQSVDVLRSDPRFRDVVKRIGLPQ
jgi:TolB-like protein/DNA-binding winged helix-turn-helix (wHTH) protein/Flp pilus assembly protein TadD